MIEFISGVLYGGAIGMIIFGFIGVSETDQLREIIGKLQIELEHAQGVRSPRTQDGARHE